MPAHFDPDSYVPVSERLEKFRADHPTWGLLSELLVDDGKRVMVRATVTDESDRIVAQGHAEEERGVGPVNRTSAVENAETSSWGRALANLGYEVKRGVASREEMHKANRQSGLSEMPLKGFSSPQERDAAYTTFTERSLALPSDELRKKLREHPSWPKPWPATKEQLEDLSAYLSELEKA